MSVALAMMPQPTQSATLHLNTCADGLFDILQASVSVFERSKTRTIPAAALFTGMALPSVGSAAGSGRLSRRYLFKINSRKTSEKHLFIVGKITGSC